MTDLIKIVALGVLQGITEMLPVSSSGHLVVMGHLVAVPNSDAIVEMALHVGTLLSILIFYRQRLIVLLKGAVSRDPDALRYLGLVILSSIPICIAGLVFRDLITEWFSDPKLVAFCLIGTGCVLALLFLPEREEAQLSPGRALLVGIAQVVALLPGVSRSGITIVTARRLGIAPAAAAEFSFFVSIIPLLGVSGLAALDLLGAQEAGGIGVLPLLVGTLVSALTGWAALSLLVRMLASHAFRYFAFYCIGLGLVLMFVF